jgi:transcriptional regulator with XRE-family HTH domain
LRRRELARRLKELREDAGLSGRALAAEFGWSQAKVSRGERGETMLPVADIRRWLVRCAASEDEAARLLEIAEEASVEAIANRHVNRWGHAKQQRDRIERQATAQVIEIYQPEVIPGLLQTPDYMRELLLAIGSATPDTVADSIEARIARQQAVLDAGVMLDIVITEPALAWQPSTVEISDGQLARLIELAARPNIRVGVISAEAQRHILTSNAFVLTRWPHDRAVVEVESLTAEMTISDPDDVQVYAEMFKLQAAHAAYGQAAEAVISAIRARLD